MCIRDRDQLKAFDLDYGWGAPFRSWDNPAAIRKLWGQLRNERPRGGAKFIRFIDNHDFANDHYQNRLEKQWGPARIQAALVALFTLDGVPFLYNGQEVADAARHSIFGKAPIDWANGETDAGKARFAFCRELCTMRKAEKALTQGDVVWLDSDAPEAGLSFLRKAGQEEILTVVNLTGKPIKLSVKGTEGVFKTLLAKGVSGDAQAGLALEPHGYFVGKK